MKVLQIKFKEIFKRTSHLVCSETVFCHG